MEKLAKMAMLGENDVKRLLPDVERMLAMAEILKGVEATYIAESVAGNMRSDEPCDKYAEGGYIVVPKVVGE